MAEDIITLEGYITDNISSGQNPPITGDELNIAFKKIIASFFNITDHPRPEGVDLTTAQVIDGFKTYIKTIYANQGLDVDGQSGNTTLNLGTANSSIVNIGQPTSVINIPGTIANQNQVNLDIEDVTITLNKGGAAATAGGAGICVEEGGANTGYFKFTGDRNKLEFKVPNVNSKLILDFSNLSTDKTVVAKDIVQADMSFHTPSINSGNVNIDLMSNQFYNAKIILTENVTLALTNPIEGGYGTIILDQDATGGRTVTLPTTSKVINGALTISTDPNTRTILTYLYDGTDFNWNYGGNYASI